MDSGVNVSGITSSINLNVTGIATIAQASSTTLSVSGVSTFTNDLSVTSGNIDVSDNVRIKLGTGDDMQIWHDGTTTKFSDSGPVLFYNTSFTVQSPSAENIIVGTQNSSVDLYYDNTKRLYTTSSGAECDGYFKATGGSGFGFIAEDNVKVSLGTGNDLNLIHDGNNSTISNNTGGLYLQSDTNINIDSKTGSHQYIHCQKGAEVSLWHNNSKKLETTSSGAKVTGALEVTGNATILGTLTYEDVKNVDAVGISTARQGLRITAGGLDVVGVSTFNDNVKLLDSDQLQIGTGGDLKLYHDGTHNYISASTAGQDLKIINNGNFLVQTSAGDSVIRGIKDGAVDLWYDNSKKLETTSSGINVTGVTVDDGATHDGDVTFTGATSNILWDKSANTLLLQDSVFLNIGTGNDLQLYHNPSNNHSYISEQGSGSLVVLADDFYIQDTSTNSMIQCIEGAQVQLHYAGNKKLETTSSGADITGILNIKNTEGLSASLYLIADDGDDNGDGWRLNSNQDDNDLTISNNVSGSYVDKLTLQNDGDLYTTGDVYTTSGKHIIVNTDNGRIKIGGSQDMQLWHDGSHSHIQHENTGNLYVLCKSGQINFETGSEIMAQMIPNGACKLYHNNTWRLITTSSGAQINGTLDVDRVDCDGLFHIQYGSSTNTNYMSSMSNNNGIMHLFRGDGLFIGNNMNTSNQSGGPNNKAIELKTDGSITATGVLTSNSIYTTGEFNMSGNGNKYLDFYTLANSNAVTFRHHNPSGNGFETFATFTANGAATLSYDGTTKLATTSAGISITGNISLPSGNLYTGDNRKLMIGTSDDLQTWHDGTDSIIRNTTGDLYIQNSASDIEIAAEDNVYIKNYDGQTSARFIEDGASELYYDDALRLSTKSFGVQVEMTPRMDLYGTGNNIELKFITNSGTHRGSVYADNGNTIGFLKAGTGSWAARWHSDGKQTSHGAIWPNASNSYNLGSGSYRWNEAYIKKLSLNTSSTNSQLTINSGSANNAVSIRNTTGGNGHVGILFSTQDHSGGREKAAIYHVETHGTAHYGGDIAFCLNTATGSAGQVSLSDRKATITRHGGICFGTDTADANCLDDYEEGSFTPTYGWSDSSQSGFSMSSNYGRYTKIGRTVHIQWWTNFSATPNSNSTLQMQLPFASRNDAGYRGGIPFSWSQITYSSHSSTTQGGRTHINYNKTWMELGFRSDQNGGTWSSGAIAPSGMSNTASFQGEGVYMCND